MPDDEMVTFRLGPKDRAAIQRLVDDGDFQNRSDFLRYAVKSTLEGRHRRVTPDLTLEAVELPEHGSPARASRPRGRKGVTR